MRHSKEADEGRCDKGDWLESGGRKVLLDLSECVERGRVERGRRGGSHWSGWVRF